MVCIASARSKRVAGSGSAGSLILRRNLFVRLRRVLGALSESDRPAAAGRGLTMLLLAFG